MPDSRTSNGSGDANHTLSKRPRPVLSCIFCRSKKLKCDRLLPCEQCIKSGRRAQCQYDNETPIQGSRPTVRADDNSSRPHKIPRLGPQASQDIHIQTPNSLHSGTVHEIASAKAGVIEDLQERVKNIEQILKVSQAGQASVQSQVAIVEPPTESEPISTVSEKLSVFKGEVSFKGFGSKFLPANDRRVLFGKFTEAKEALWRSFSDPSIRQDLDSLRSLFPKKNVRYVPPILTNTSQDMILSQIVDALPPREICEKLVEDYSRAWEKSLRIIHLPSASRILDEFFGSERHQQVAFGTIIPQVAVIIVIASSLQPEGTSYRVSFDPNHLLALVETWLNSISDKKRFELCTLSTQCLHVLASFVRGTAGPDELYKRTGSLTRAAMCMGLHVPPSETQGLPPFEAEQRRRVWASILELDLQASLLSGMPPTLRADEIELEIPSELSDHQVDSALAPSSQNFKLYPTTMIYQLVLARTVKIRTRIAAVVASRSGRFDIGVFNELFDEFDRVLHEHDLPERQISYTEIDVVQNSFAYTTFEVFLYRPLNFLYSPILFEQVQRGTSEHDVGFSRSATCYNVLLQHAENLKYSYHIVNMSDMSNVHLQTWRCLYDMCGNDCIQIAYVLCLAIWELESSQTRSNVSGNILSSPRAVFGHSSPNPSNSSSSRAENMKRQISGIIAVILKNKECLKTTIKDIICLSVTLEVASRYSSAASPDTCARDGIARVVRLVQERYSKESSGAIIRTPSSMDANNSVEDNRNGILEATSGDGFMSFLDLDLDFDFNFTGEMS